MCFALFMVMLDNTVVNVSLPSIQRDLHASLSSLEWTVNAYTLTFAVLMVTGGRLGDIFGRRTLFLFGVVVFGCSSLAIGFSPSDAWLVGFRAVQGIGAAFMMPATLSIITQAFPPEQRGTAIGTWAGVSAMALAIGPVLGGFLTQDVNWRAIFFINPPIAIITVAVTLFAARNSRDETVSRSVDLPRDRGHHGRPHRARARSGGRQPLALGLGPDRRAARACRLGLIGFAVIEMRVRAPMVNFAFFRSRSFLGANVVGFFVSFAMLAQFFFLALYMQNISHYSPLQIGAAVPALHGRARRHGPARRPAHRSCGPPAADDARPLTLVSAAIFLQSGITVHTSYLRLLPGFVLMGLGIGLVMSPMSTAAMNAVDRTKAGAASGVLSMSRMVGGTFGVAVMGALIATLGRSNIDSRLPQLPADTRAQLANALGQRRSTAGRPRPACLGHRGVRQAFVSALGSGLEIGAITTLCGAIAAWVLIEKKLRSAPATAPAPRGDDAATAPAEVEAAEPAVR